jgi:hypothetical protein
MDPRSAADPAHARSAGAEPVIAAIGTIVVFLVAIVIVLLYDERGW